MIPKDKVPRGLDWLSNISAITKEKGRTEGEKKEKRERERKYATEEARAQNLKMMSLFPVPGSTFRNI